MKAQCVFTFMVNHTPTCLIEWVGKLVCTTEKEPSKPVSVSMWNRNGTLFQNIFMSTTTSKVMVVHKNRLWQGSEGYLCIWEDPTNWKSERLLWLGWKKNPPSNCRPSFQGNLLL
mmetsp:Transcript_522/g.743  ORF Transcript_522/g.743 Transcript_522/m.743 type:complete len:115 (+) Transcript_522:132-476(+)